MNLLAIDTSTKNLSLAVAKNSKVVKSRNRKLTRPLSSSIMPAIKKILDDAKLSLAQLDGFAVGLGPGSFTSLRVGLSTIKGLAFATGKPVVGIPSLDVLAMNVQAQNVRVCVLSDAKRNLVYASLYDKNGTQLKRQSDYHLTSIQEVLKEAKGKVTFIGDGIKLFKGDIQKAKGVTPTFIDGKQTQPQAKHLITLGIERFQKGKGDSVDKLVPLYLYPEHCQVRN